MGLTSFAPAPTAPILLQLGARPLAALGLVHANPTATSSASVVMMGCGDTFTITPVNTGRFLITIMCSALNGTLLDGGTIGLYTGTGTAPVNGAAVTGTLRGIAQNFISSTANAYNVVTLTAVVTGLIVGTPYWVDLGVNTVIGGQVTVFFPCISATEF